VTRGAVVVAGGGVLWRGDPLDPKVALVHRPEYDDWSLPKGKAKAGEHVLVAAMREVAEETGHLPRIGPHLVESRYQVRSGGRSARKVVSYWSMRAVGGEFVPSREVDEMAWLSLRDARRSLTAARDREVLDVFARTPRDTAAIMLVRHAATSAPGGRARGSRLNRSGRLQAGALVPILEGLGVSDLLSADVPSCVETVRPVASATGLAVHRDAGLSRDAFLGNERDVAERLRRSSTESDGLVVCAQQPVLVGLLSALGRDGGRRARRPAGIKKGGWWLVHHHDGIVQVVERFEPAA
jgi:8-oxo-dGTP diphosphatase